MLFARAAPCGRVSRRRPLSPLRFAVAPNSEGEFWTAIVVYHVFTIYQIEIQRRGLLAQIVVRHSRSIVLPPVDECNVEFIRKVFLLSHRTVPNEAGDHRAALNSLLAEGGSLTPPYEPPPQA